MRLLFLERDIDKALRRMGLEEEKNLTETVNDILWKGLKDYKTNRHKPCFTRNFVLLPILLLTGSNNLLNFALICHNL